MNELGSSLFWDMIGCLEPPSCFPLTISNIPSMNFQYSHYENNTNIAIGFCAQMTILKCFRSLPRMISRDVFKKESKKIIAGLWGS